MMWYQILALIGIPSMVTALLNFFERKAIRKETEKIKQADKSDALAQGVQALLRAQMISDYTHYSEKGFAPIYARESFENVWTQYEALGKNGVMQDIHKKFLALPTRKDEEA